MTVVAARSPATHIAPELTLRSAEIRALLALTFLYPVVICVLFFPSPSGDLREQINFAQFALFYNWKNPPLQTWAAGLVALTGVRDSWPYVLLAQMFNVVALVYLALTARKFVRHDAVVPLVIMFCGSGYYSLAIPSMALNADQLLAPIWAGILYHALSAARDDCWRDWLACGTLVGLGFLDKYNTAALVLLLLAIAAHEAPYRKIFRNVRLYVAGLVSVPIIAVHAVPEFFYGANLGYALFQFKHTDVIATTLRASSQFFRSIFLYGLPVCIGLAAVAWKGGVSPPRMPHDAAQRFIVILAGALSALMLILILGGTLNYSARHTYSYFGFILLAILCVVRVSPEGLRRFAKVVLGIWVAIVIGTLIYSQMFIHTLLREPLPDAALAFRGLWDQDFDCGPAYIFGDHRTARGLAAYFNPPVPGIPFDEFNRLGLIPEKLERGGAIVVATSGLVLSPAAKEWFDDHPLAALMLPYRRTFKTNQHTYVYYFIPPRGCMRVTAPARGGAIDIRGVSAFDRFIAARRHGS